MVFRLPFILLIPGILIAGALRPALACQICIPFPKKSAVDYLIESEVVVLAREDLNRPFHYKPVEVLKGDAGDEPIELFLNSTTRRILSIYPDRSVVLGGSVRNEKMVWERIGLTNADFSTLVRDTLKLASSWKEDPAERVDYFAKLLGHEDRQISSLAHLEISRADYREIRRLRNLLPREDIYKFLNNVRYIEWHALYILLLSQSDDPRDHEFIKKEFRSAAKFRISLRLAAWATAYIEIDREKALAEIEDLYFCDLKRNLEELSAILQATSVHGTSGNEGLRDRILKGYGELLANHPARAVNIVNDLRVWGRGDLRGPISIIVADPPSSLSFGSVIKLRKYLRSTEGESK